MLLKQFYEQAGGNYEEVTRRLMNEDFVKKFLLKFIDDKSYELLMANVDNDNKEAFRAAHTLKGVCQNLGLGKLYSSSVAVTEALRNGKNDVTKEMLDEITKDYEMTIELIKELD